MATFAILGRCIQTFPASLLICRSVYGALATDDASDTGTSPILFSSTGHRLYGFCDLPIAIFLAQWYASNQLAQCHSRFLCTNITISCRWSGTQNCAFHLSLCYLQLFHALLCEGPNFHTVDQWSIMNG